MDWNFPEHGQKNIYNLDLPGVFPPVNRDSTAQVRKKVRAQSADTKRLDNESPNTGNTKE